ncbi:MAG: L-fucose isomerase, partial [Clostridia bacterium]|nr:L-fucose isomerase [Clostridia bacterium]
MANETKKTAYSPINRYQEALPKIGIRPIIDGRRTDALEVQTMNMAESAAQFLSENLRYSTGQPVECVVANTTIANVEEAAKTAEQFKKEGVGVSISVTPCWCYGSETMDMDPLIPKAIWGFNGTERPGAVYLAAVLAAHAQKGLPAFGIYGGDVQDINDTTIPEDVQQKLLQFARAGLAAATMRNKSYLAMGSTSMGIAGSMVNHDFFENYLGMRVEQIDMSEFIRRLNLDMYDHEEFEKAIAWTRENCKEGADNNPEQKSREEKDKDWETVVKMTLITRDLMIGNPKLAEMGYPEAAMGKNAIASGFQGQRQWTDFMSTGDFMESILNSSFDWNGAREAYIVATENDTLNAASMIFGHLLTNTAQIFADVRTYWSPDSVKRVTGKELTGLAENGVIHLINSGSCTLDATGEQEVNGKPAMKPYWEITPEEVDKCLKATKWRAASKGYFPGGGYSSNFLTKGGMPLTMVRLNLVKGLGPVLQIAEGYSADLDPEVHEKLDERTDPTWPTTWFAPILTGEGPFKDVYSVMNNWGANHSAIS